MQDTNDPSYKHPLLEDIQDKLELVQTLWGGTASMREAGTDYLPKEPGEESQNYLNRLNRSVLFPAYKQAVKTNTGKLFVKDVIVDDPSVDMTDTTITVDQEDNDITSFATMLTESAIHQGCAYILVDYPIMNSNSTMADERAIGGRPYWILIKQTQVLEATPILINGKQQLGVFRFQEEIPYRDGLFAIKYRTQIKQFTLINNQVGYTVFRKDQGGKWSLFDEGILSGIDEIPVTAANVNRAGYFIGSPVFYDLAEENVLNWQMRSDYNNIVHHSQVPMLQIKGVQSQFDEQGARVNPIVISPNTVLEFNDPSADASWIEVSGQAATVGSNSLEQSEIRMEQMSLEMLSKVDSKSTATAAKIDAMESYSVLQSIGKTVEQTLDNAINFTYKYLGIPNPGTTTVINIDDAVVSGGSEDINHLISLNQSNLLTDHTTLKEIKRRGLISDEVNIDEELQMLTNTEEVTTGQPINDQQVEMETI